MLVCRDGFGAALREPYSVLEHLDLTIYVRRVLVPLSAYVRAGSSYVGDQPFVFEGSGRAYAGGLRLDTPERLRLYYARSALSTRARAAASRLGTGKPSELAGALYRLSPGAHANRAKLLDGVRLLPLGRFYAGNKDVYPEIVDSWREISKPPPGSAPVSPAGA